MPSFFVPIDFSPSSQRAFEYALLLAKHTKGNLILYHGYSVLVNTEVLYPTAGYFELEFSGQEERIGLEFDRFLASYQLHNVDIRRIIKAGFVSDDIDDLAKRYGADLIVMGTKGASGLKEVLIGSVTAGVARNCETPLLIIPISAEIKLPKDWVYALSLEKTDEEIIQKILQFRAWFSANLTLLRISHQENEHKEAQIIEDLQKTLAHKTTNLKIETIRFADVPEGLDLYSKGVSTDLMAVYMHQYGFFERLFHQSVSEQLAYHTTVPLLVMKSAQ